MYRYVGCAVSTLLLTAQPAVAPVHSAASGNPSRGFCGLIFGYIHPYVAYPLVWNDACGWCGGLCNRLGVHVVLYGQAEGISRRGLLVKEGVPVSVRLSCLPVVLLVYMSLLFTKASHCLAIGQHATQVWVLLGLIQAMQAAGVTKAGFGGISPACPSFGGILPHKSSRRLAGWSVLDKAE